MWTTNSWTAFILLNQAVTNRPTTAFHHCFCLVTVLSCRHTVSSNNACQGAHMHHCLYVINYQIFQTTAQRVQFQIAAASNYNLFYSYCVTHSWIGCSHGAVMHSVAVLWRLLHVSSDTRRSVSLMRWDCTRIPWNSSLCNLRDTNQHLRGGLIRWCGNRFPI